MTASRPYIPRPRDVLQAASRLCGVAHRTPVHTSSALDRMIGARVYLKCESFQRAGAFKFRGAFNALSLMDPARRAAGVLTHSSGNHGQALALAASIWGTAATVVMPDDASPSKRAAAFGYGARVVPCKPGEREVVAERLAASEGLSLVHPYDDSAVIAGQGTAALELIEEVNDLDMILVPVGGGGLCGGTCRAAASARRGCRVIGVEPEGADDAIRSWRTGRVHELDAVPTTVADGLRTRRVGIRNLELMRAHLHEMATVSDAEILRAVHLLWTRLKLVVEPSGATALSALLAGKMRAHGKKVGVIVSGGNIDPEATCALLAEAGHG